MTDYAYVLSRIGGKGSDERVRADHVFDYVVKPAAKHFGLEVRRSDKESKPGPVTVHMIRSMERARVLIADLTGRNANVYYELGIAHALALPTAILIDTASSNVFDTKDERTIELGDAGELGAAKADAARSELEKTLSVILTEGYQPSNVVTEAATQRSLSDLAPENPVASELASIRERIESIDDFIRDFGDPRRTTASDGADIMSMKRFIEALAGSDRLTADEIERLVTKTTSPSLDRWAEELSGRVRASGTPDAGPF